MPVKRIASACFLTSLLIASGPVNVAAQQKARKQPNIIFILADDQGYGDLGAFFQNRRAQTKDASKPVEYSPNLDRLAAQGAMLTDYYVAAPICAPSRASLMLGVSQGHANVRDNEFDKALEDNYTMPSTLRTLGYSTALVGKWGLEGNDKYDIDGYKWPAHPLNRGFDYYFGYMRHSDGHEHYPKEALYRKYWAESGKQVWQNRTNMTPDLDKCYTADLWTAAAKKYITDHTRGTEKSKPFFLYLAYETPHAVQELPTQAYPAGGGLHGGMQWLGTPGHFISTASGTPDSWHHPDYANAVYDHDHDPSTPAIPWPETFKRYATANRRIDDAVGDIMTLLRDLKIDSNTIVVYTSDNGPSNESYLPENKFPPNKPTFFSSYGPFEGMKADTWEGGVRLPAIVRWPGHVAAGKTIATPVIAYDWAPTFIDIAGQQAPERMDGVSLKPMLTGTGLQQQPIVYIEYHGDNATPAYPEFAPEKRNRVRGQTQLLRVNDYVGVRYDIQSASDDFEIYDVVHDPAELHNLAKALPELQSHIKDRVLQLRHAGNGSPRSYDSALVPSVKVNNLTQGLDWKTYDGKFPWIPQTFSLIPALSGNTPIPEFPGAAKKIGVTTVFAGYLSIPRDGEYTFYLTCDGKAFLRLHDIQVTDADYGYNGSLPRVTTLFLKAGMHPFHLAAYRGEEKGEPFIKLDWSGPGLARQRIPAAAFFHAPEEGKGRK